MCISDTRNISWNPCIWNVWKSFVGGDGNFQCNASSLPIIPSLFFKHKFCKWSLREINGMMENLMRIKVELL